MIDLSGVTEFVPFWAPVTLLAMFAVSSAVALVVSIDDLRDVRPNSGAFAKGMAIALVLTIAVGFLAWGIEATVWNLTSSESAVLQSEIERVYGVTFGSDVRIVPGEPFLGEDRDGSPVVLRYDAETGELVSASDWETFKG